MAPNLISDKVRGKVWFGIHSDFNSGVIFRIKIAVWGQILSRAWEQAAGLDLEQRWERPWDPIVSRQLGLVVTDGVQRGAR